MFLPGISGNPAGKPANIFNWASFSTRIKELACEYSCEEILKYSSNNKLLSKEFSSWDALLILSLADAYKDGKGRERLFDRTMGKAVQRVESTVTVNHNNALAIENLNDDELVNMMDSLEALAASRANTTEIVSEAVTVKTSVREDGGRDGDGRENNKKPFGFPKPKG